MNIPHASTMRSREIVEHVKPNTIADDDVVLEHIDNLIKNAPISATHVECNYYIPTWMRDELERDLQYQVVSTPRDTWRIYWRL